MMELKERKRLAINIGFTILAPLVLYLLTRMSWIYSLSCLAVLLIGNDVIDIKAIKNMYKLIILISIMTLGTIAITVVEGVGDNLSFFLICVAIVSVRFFRSFYKDNKMKKGITCKK